MTLTITPTGATLGAIVTGVDLANLDDAVWADIERAFLAHAVLIFPGQHLSDAAQIGFGRRFGAIEQLVAGREIVSISNQRADGTLMRDDEHGMQLMRGNEGWHTDSSYMPLAAKASVLSAHVVPSTGGQTEWADMRAAYDALDEGTKARIATLSAYHSLYYSQGRIGHKAAVGSSYGFHTDDPPLRPLVKVHPVTGRKSLFIGRHAYGIPGLESEESEKLLGGLVTFACQAPRTYSHTWQPGDVVVWDNRCVLHRAHPFDHSEPRVMKHTRVAGDPASELAVQRHRMAP
ncbi:MAG TPA: TauD/TfdA family dioxygenase [Candidatus Binatia bacterium]|nr:TauD/TfdA family dioxygenase [Candidatus Binatia bacterium]